MGWVLWGFGSVDQLGRRIRRSLKDWRGEAVIDRRIIEGRPYRTVEGLLRVKGIGGEEAEGDQGVCVVR